MKLRVVSLLVLVAIATAIAAGGAQTSPFGLLALLLAGVLGAGGCGAVNAYIDRDIDPVMRRTSTRPLPMQEICPESRALYFGITLIAFSLILAAWLLNPLTAGLIMAGAAVYLFVYTLWLKRRTSLSIIWGGFAGCFPVLAGWAAVTGSISPVSVLLALVVLVWIPGHNWTFAIRTKQDYERAGIPVLPSKIGDDKTMKLSVVSVVGVLAVVLVSAGLGYASAVFAVIVMVATFIVLAAGLHAVGKPTPQNAWRVYKMLSVYLAVIFAAAAIQPLIIGI
jgi:protoheme IX farnesyltransferase